VGIPQAPVLLNGPTRRAPASCAEAAADHHPAQRATGYFNPDFKNRRICNDSLLWIA